MKQAFSRAVLGLHAAGVLPWFCWAAWSMRDCEQSRVEGQKGSALCAE